MKPILNSMIVYNTNSYPLECQINGLTNNQLYYVRVASGNHKGFSQAQAASPSALSPSSWRQVEGNKRRKYDEEVFRKFTKLILLNKHILDDHQPIQVPAQSKPSAISAINAINANQNNKSSLINMLLLDATQPSNGQQQEAARSEAEPSGQVEVQQSQSVSVRKNLKNFFQSNSFKFHKLSNQNKRGLYLTTVIYHCEPQSGKERQWAAPSLSANLSSANDKILVTNDERLPVIEVINDLVSPAALMSDFYWLLKINGTHWMDIKRLRQQLQKSHSSSTLHLRIKLLGAIEQMQLALNMEDIGRLFYKPIQAHDGSLLICTSRQLASTKLVSNLSIKWSHQHKIIPRHLRKISDSMLAGPRKQRASSEQPPAPPAGATILPASTLREAPDAGGAEAGQLRPQPDAGKLCGACQIALSQRRCTMTSGSSAGSSLALSGASGEGAWQQQQQAARCTCNRSQSSSNPMQLISNSLIASARAGSNSTTRSGSMISTTTPSHHGSMSSARLSQAANQLQVSGAQKSSTYLMLAALSLYDLLLFTMNEIIDFDKTSSVPLNRGLYLGFVQLQTTVESMRLLVPRARPNMVPCARIRDNAHVSKEEWQLLKRFASMSAATPTRNQRSAAPEARVSDPSIWSLEADFCPAAGAAASSDRSAIDPRSGFERDRAKSVSPGLMATAVASRTADCLSVSSERIPAQTRPPPDGQSPAVSDPNLADLCAGLESGEAARRPQQRSASKTSVGSKMARCRSSTGASRLTVNSGASFAQSPEETFMRLVGSAARRLLAELKSNLPLIYDEQIDQMASILQSLNDDENNRLYHIELIELNSQVNFILLIPSAENVCPVTSQEKSNILADNKEFMLLPLQIFEIIHIRTYEPDLLGKYSRLSAILETDLIVAQHDHRQAFSSNELKSTKSRVSHLQDMVSIADEFWRQLRWIVDVVSFARDKSASAAQGGIKLGTIWRYFELSPSVSYDNSLYLIASNTEQTTGSHSQVYKAQPSARSGCEVKRTTSARVRDNRPAVRDSGPRTANRMTCSKVGAVESVPDVRASSRSDVKLLVNNSEAQQQPASQVNSKLDTDAEADLAGSSKALARRHSGDFNAKTSQQANSLSQYCDWRVCQAFDEGDRIEYTMFSDSQVKVKQIREDALNECDQNSCPDRSVQQLRDASMNEDDEEAIYAYHISLRDATRVASQRKSAQLSISACELEPATSSSPGCSTFAGSEAGGLIEWSQFESNDQADTVCLKSGEAFVESRATSGSEAVSPDKNALLRVANKGCRNKTGHHSTTSASTSSKKSDHCHRDRSRERVQDESAADMNGRSTECKPEASKRSLKTTNPFLSDSFDYT